MSNIPHGGTDKYYSPSNKVVHDGDTARAADLNVINDAVDVSFEEVSGHLDTLETLTNNNNILSERWASADAGIRPVTTQIDDWSSQANARESQGWANAAEGAGIGLADGTTSLEESAKTHATNASSDAQATAADLVQTNQDTIDTAADLVQTNQDTIDTAADLVQTNQDTIDASGSAALANKWAEELEDVEVTAGHFSALHWSSKAAAGNPTVSEGVGVDIVTTGGPYPSPLDYEVTVNKTEINLNLVDNTADSNKAVLSATKLIPGRTIEVTGDITSAPQLFDGVADVAISAAVVNDSHTHDTRYHTETESDARFAFKAGSTSQSFSSFSIYCYGTLDSLNNAYTYKTHYTGRSAALGYYAGSGRFQAYHTDDTNSSRCLANNTTGNIYCHDIKVAGLYRVALSSNGNGYFDGVADAGGADYAEYYEWNDGNPNGEDRIGRSVIFVEDTDTIRLTTPEDDPSKILGIISAMPAIVGNTAAMSWGGKDNKDEWGRRIKRTIKIYSFNYIITKDDGTTSEEYGEFRGDGDFPEGLTEWPLDAVVTEQEEWDVNPDYLPNQDYMPREDRPEWDAVGLLGKLRMANGDAVGDRWIKIRVINESITEWLVR